MSRRQEGSPWLSRSGYGRGYSAPENDAGSEYHSVGSGPDGDNARSPEADSPGWDGEQSDHPEGEQYNSAKENANHLSSDDSEPVYS